MGKTPQIQRSPQAIALLERAKHALDTHDLNTAETLAAQALQMNPLDSDAVHLLANAYLHRREFAKAVELARHCIALNSGNGAYYLTLGVILQEQGKIDEAMTMNEKALSLDHTGYTHFIYNNMGICYYHKRELFKAIEHYGMALAAAPDFAPALFRRGVAWYELKGANSPEMLADFDRAVELDPDNAMMLQQMTSVCHEKHDYVEAIKLLRRAITLRPNLEEAWVKLAHSYYKIGNTTTALAIYEDLAKRFPNNPTVKMEPAYMFPAIPMSDGEIVEWRERFMRNLDRLMKENFTVRDPEWRVLTLPFYQGYHGQNNLPLMKKMAEFFLHSCPELHFTAAHCDKKPVKKDKVRIGFVSEMFHSDLLSQFYGPLLDALAKDARFEVILMANSGRKNESVDQLASSVTRYVTLSTHLPFAQRMIEALEIDMLIHLDIGLNAMNYLLAFARLAPIQIVMGGHPITTGIPNIDYFLSSHAVEPADAAQHYSEKLLLLERNTVVFRRKKVPTETKTRAELGLPEDARLYACPVLLFKLHPDMDKIFAAILKRDPKALIILFDSKYRTLWRASLQKRFGLSMPPEDVARIHFLPFASGDLFYYYMRVMDCVLDTLHFSFGTTAFLMLGADVPYVTLPGAFQRGRCGAMLYQQMGMDELTAQSPEHYVELALKLAQDKLFHAYMAETIRKNSDNVFDDYSVVEPFVSMLWDLYAERAADHG